MKTGNSSSIAGALLKWALPAVLLGALSAQAADPTWSPVAPGIDYGEVTLDGPVRVYLARADRSVKTWTIDSMSSFGEIAGGRETVPDMVRRCDDSITFDGHRYKAHVAINGTYFDMRSGVAFAGQVMAGWYAKRYDEYAGNSGFVWTSDRRCFIGGNTLNSAKLQYVTFADGARMPLETLNLTRTKDGLALYTAQFAADTATPNDGVEVIVHVDAPLPVLPKAPGAPGKIVQVRQSAGSTRLFFDQIVLSAGGKAAAELTKHAHPGEDIHVVLELQDIGNTDSKVPAGDWHNAYASIGSTRTLLVNGVVPRDWEKKAAKRAAEGKKDGSVVKDPRTCIAFNDHYIYFCVIDGRYSKSIGMTFTETGEFCRDVLKATHANMQDGGGSSTLWINGKVKNHVSGKPGQDEPGELRPVANGYFIAEVLDPKFSNALHADQKIVSVGPGEVRLGPGTNYAITAKLDGGIDGKITTHRLNGVFAKGASWWFCSFGTVRGWIPAEQIKAAS